MSQWEGADGQFNERGLPHVTRIRRKPKPVGAEIKCCADGESGIMLRLEIQKGAAAMAHAEFTDQYQANTALTLRLLKPWFNTGRLVHADSAFASKGTAVAIMCHGLQFIGLVKTAYREFPKFYFDTWASTNPARGSTVALETEVNVHGTVRKF